MSGHYPRTIAHTAVLGALISLSAPLRVGYAEGDVLLIATFNVYYANTDLSQVVKTIDAACADIVCLQESHPQLERMLSANYRAKYPYAYSAGHLGKIPAERLTMLSTLRLHDVKFHPPKRGFFGTLVAVAKLRDRDVQIVNAHLSPFLIEPGNGIAAAYAGFRRTEKLHEAEAQEIVAELKPDIATIVCGDFNSPSAFAAPRCLTAWGLTDSFAAVTENPDSHATWRVPLQRRELSARIDYIFHSRHFTTKSSRVVTTPSSDHAMVASELEFREDNQ